MEITIYSICWNEEFLLQQYFDWYKFRFPKANFVVYDNESTDNSVKICKENGALVIPYSTDNQLSDSKYLEIKNNCWKGNSGWVLIGDVDEWLDIDYLNLKQENTVGHTLIKSRGWNMCNKKGLTDYAKITTGIRSNHYDKFLCFKASEIKEINYEPGAHSIKPIGNLQYSDNKYDLLHMKFLNEDYIVNRYLQFKNRMSMENHRNGWGIQYKAEEEQIRIDFKNHLEASLNIYA